VDLEATACVHSLQYSYSIVYHTVLTNLLIFNYITGSLIVVWLAVFLSKKSQSLFYAVFNVSRKAVLFLLGSRHGQHQA